MAGNHVVSEQDAGASVVINTGKYCIKLRDGTVRKYVYYHCSRFDQTCKQPYVREDELLVQFLVLIGTVDLDKTGMRKKLEVEVEKMNRFTADVLGMQNDVTIPKMDIRGYAKYVLKNGKVEEKREIFGCQQTQLILHDSVVSLPSVRDCLA